MTGTRTKALIIHIFQNRKPGVPGHFVPDNVQLAFSFVLASEFSYYPDARIGSTGKAYLVHHHYLIFSSTAHKAHDAGHSIPEPLGLMLSLSRINFCSSLLNLH